MDLPSSPHVPGMGLYYNPSPRYELIKASRRSRDDTVPSSVGFVSRTALSGRLHRKFSNKEVVL